MKTEDSYEGKIGDISPQKKEGRALLTKMDMKKCLKELNSRVDFRIA